MTDKLIYMLYGINIEFFQKEIGGPFESTRRMDLVATFSTRSLAQDYVNKRLLKKPIPGRGFQHGRLFKKNTELEDYDDYEIQSEYPSDVPHDPE